MRAEVVWTVQGTMPVIFIDAPSYLRADQAAKS